MKVIYSNKGLANFFGGYIEIHKNLKNDKELRDYIVLHELEHTQGFDIGHEVLDGFKLIKNPRIIFKIIKFYFLNPSTWLDLLPLQIRKKKLVYDINLIILYSLTALLILFLIYLI